MSPSATRARPLDDRLERFAITTFLTDTESHLLLAKSFELSIGLAQVTPVTALTALKVCRTTGQPWDIWFKHLRDVPDLGGEWQLGPEAIVVLSATCASGSGQQTPGRIGTDARLGTSRLQP